MTAHFMSIICQNQPDGILEVLTANTIYLKK